MSTPDVDQPPEMITISLRGEEEEGEGLVIQIPEASLRNLEADKRAQIISSLANVIVAMSGRAGLNVPDLTDVLRVDGTLMSIPGAEHPIELQELLGSVLIRGSASELAAIINECD